MATAVTGNRYSGIDTFLLGHDPGIRADYGKDAPSRDNLTLDRHIRQDGLDIVLRGAENRQARRDLNVRRHLMAQSSTQPTRCRLKRARWRLWKARTQDLLVAAVYYIRTLVEYSGKRKPAPINWLPHTRV